MWCQKSPQEPALGPASNTIWRQKTANQAANGSVEAWLAARGKWLARRLFLGHSDPTAKKQSGLSACHCPRLTAAKHLRNGRKSPIHFLKKWVSTTPNTRGRPIGMILKMTIFTSGFAEFQQMARYGIRSIQPSARSKHVPNWRVNLN